MHGIPQIKICGITTPTEIEYINELCPDYIGFVFARSKRQVTLDEAVILRSKLKQRIRVVGVFVNESANTVREIVTRCGLDIIQLHGNEKIEDYIGQTPIWKCVNIKDRESIQEVGSHQMVERWVIDTYTKGSTGGSGVSFEWEYAKGLSKNHNIVLAGGLNACNVAQAIQITRPQVVDVSSGVEENGKKSFEKMKRFIEEVRKNEIKI